MTGHTLTILAAEDDTLSRTLLGRLLTRMGHHPLLVEDGAAALETAATQSVDAILMDAHMPVMDGETATKLIRNLPGAIAQVPIIGLATTLTPEARQNFLAAGGNTLLAKPVSIATLARALTEALSGHAAAAHPDDNAAPVLDMDYVEDMRHWVGDATVTSLMTSAPQSFTQELADLREAWHEGDIQTVREKAHRLKGAAGSVGCRRLSDLAQIIQKLPEPDLQRHEHLEQLVSEVAAASAATIRWAP